MDPIVEKIEKLLALATSSNEHEARLAAAKANELLIRHNLQAQFGADPRLRKYIAENVREQLSMPPEHRWVQGIIRDHFFVEMVTAKLGRRRCRFVMLGTPTNVAIAKHVYVFLCRAYRKGWNVYRKEHRARPSARRAYWLGLSGGLHAQLRGQRAATEADLGAVVTQDEALAEFVKDYFGGGLKTSRQQRRPRTSNALLAGFQDGKDLRIHGAVEHQAPAGVPLLLDHQTQF